MESNNAKYPNLRKHTTDAFPCWRKCVCAWERKTMEKWARKHTHISTKALTNDKTNIFKSFSLWFYRSCLFTILLLFVHSINFLFHLFFFCIRCALFTVLRLHIFFCLFFFFFSFQTHIVQGK